MTTMTTKSSEARHSEVYINSRKDPLFTISIGDGGPDLHSTNLSEVESRDLQPRLIHQYVRSTR